MKHYTIKTNLVSIKYKIGDVITDADLSEANIAYHLSKGNIEEVAKKTQRNNKEEPAELGHSSLQTINELDINDLLN